MKIDGILFQLTCVAINGDSFAVIKLDETIATKNSDFISDFEQFLLPVYGQKIENHYWFPNKINTTVVRVRNRKEIDIRVWKGEESMACGTGACAAVVAAVVNEWTERVVTVHLRGGDLVIRWDEGG